MDIFSGDYSSLVFKSTIQDNINNLSLDSKMLQLLLKLDGYTTVSSVARSLNVDIAVLKNLLVKLLQMKVIELVESATPMLDQSFFDFLFQQLSIAVGPIADVLIEDEIMEMGFQKENVPCERAAELVERVAEEIPREDKRMEFKQAMLPRLNEM